MKIVNIGHNYEYAVQQSVSTYFPMEDVEVRTELTGNGETSTATCIINGQFTGRASTGKKDDRSLQYIVKTAVYRAYLDMDRGKPVWGSLTGVRPGKLMRQVMDIGRFMDEYDVSEERARLAYETSVYTEKAEESLGDNDACLYFGVPFCPTRCLYCSFVSQSTEKTMKLIEPYLDAVCREIKPVSSRIVSVYFGGGTPTTLTAEQLDRVCSRLESAYDFSALREFTVEAGRPDTITAEKLEVLKKHGVTRISVNPQTMNDGVLEIIGRKHTAQDVLDAVKLAGDFDINMDIIAGLPGDSPESFRNTVDTLLGLGPANITVHTLSLKKGSSLVKNIPRLPETKEMLDYAYLKLRENGYEPYYLYRQKNMTGGFENTGWTRPGHENLYNICMMEELCSVIGIGAGASTKTVGKNGEICRKVNPKYPLEYIEKYV